MTTPGYVYALLNPTLNGLIKVGKTIKDPADRAKELSAATGVPTPFSVAYQVLVGDCDNAEKFVHTFLEEVGYRVSGNREFFEAPLNIIIEAMLAAQNQFPLTQQDNFVTEGKHEDPCKIAEQLYEQAKSYLEGTGEVLQNLEKALAYFKKAAKLGSADALWQLGRMYQRGTGCHQDIEIALNYYEKAAIAGRPDCWAIMGDIYAYVGLPHGMQHIANARKCFQKYFDSDMFDYKELTNLNAIHSGVYIKDVYTVNEMLQDGTLKDKSQGAMPLEHIEKLKIIKEEIFLYLESVISSWKESDQEMVTRWQNVLTFAKNSLN